MFSSDEFLAEDLNTTPQTASFAELSSVLQQDVQRSKMSNILHLPNKAVLEFSEGSIMQTLVLSAGPGLDSQVAFPLYQAPLQELPALWEQQFICTPDHDVVVRELRIYERAPAYSNNQHLDMLGQPPVHLKWPQLPSCGTAFFAKTDIKQSHLNPNKAACYGWHLVRKTSERCECSERSHTFNRKTCLGHQVRKVHRYTLGYAEKPKCDHEVIYDRKKTKALRYYHISGISLYLVDAPREYTKTTKNARPQQDVPDNKRARREVAIQAGPLADERQSLPEPHVTGPQQYGMNSAPAATALATATLSQPAEVISMSDAPAFDIDTEDLGSLAWPPSPANSLSSVNKFLASYTLETLQDASSAGSDPILETSDVAVIAAAGQHWDNALVTAAFTGGDLWSMKPTALSEPRLAGV